MIVYVGYTDYGCEGCGTPETVFVAERDAEDWVKKENMRMKFATAKYEELEVTMNTEESSTHGETLQDSSEA